MKYTTIAVSPKYRKIIKQYAVEKDTSIKAVIEKLIAELMTETQDQPLTE